MLRPAAFTVGDLRLEDPFTGSSVGDLNDQLLSVFRPSDKRIRRAPKLHVPHALASETAAAPGDVVSFEYRCSTSAVRDRLELMGFTTRVARAAFEAGLTRRREVFGDGVDESWTDRRYLEHMSLERWLDGIRVIRERRLGPLSAFDRRFSRLAPVLQSMLVIGGDPWYGYPGMDVRHALRLVVEGMPPESPVVYDLTALLGTTWSTVNHLERDAAAYVDADFADKRRTVVLTEGATDGEFIEASLRINYPHLADYFTFLNPRAARIAGGEGMLEKRVIAFASAGVTNRVLALFDNDAAGSAAVARLRRADLPRNILAQRYPRLPLAERYPVRDHGGIVHEDVNGMGASLELYLGVDVLTAPTGDLPAVLRTGWNESARVNQGQVEHKAEIQAQFRRKMMESQCALPRTTPDWSGVRAIIEAMCSAFQEVDAEELLSREC
jgi:hypothetical protein